VRLAREFVSSGSKELWSLARGEAQSLCRAYELLSPGVADLVRETCSL
jgi:hypothetical protein